MPGEQVIKRYGTLVIVLVGLVLFFNLLFGLLLITRFPPAEQLYSNGLVVRIPSLHYAMVFAHGWYITVNRDAAGNVTSEINAPDNSAPKGSVRVTVHEMMLNGTIFRTDRYVQQLHDQGYTTVWGTWCNTGDHNFSTRIELPDGTMDETPWPSYVSRNTNPGPTMPIYVGIGFIRISASGWGLNSPSTEART